jgi:hypothetical protein
MLVACVRLRASRRNLQGLKSTTGSPFVELQRAKESCISPTSIRSFQSRQKATAWLTKEGTQSWEWRFHRFPPRSRERAKRSEETRAHQSRWPFLDGERDGSLMLGFMRRQGRGRLGGDLLPSTASAATREAAAAFCGPLAAAEHANVERAGDDAQDAKNADGHPAPHTRLLRAARRALRLARRHREDPGGRRRGGGAGAQQDQREQREKGRRGRNSGP